jgi:hypothetical protein
VRLVIVRFLYGLSCMACLAVRTGLLWRLSQRLLEVKTQLENDRDARAAARNQPD